MAKDNLSNIVSLCKRRGFVFSACDIYGGLGAIWDYGPMGAMLKKNIKDSWWKTYVEQRQDSPTSGAYQIFEALFFFINLTISVAFLNLLPIPALDGGRILMAGFEMIFRRRLPPKAENWLIYVSFMLLMLLLLYVTFRDVFGLIFG